MHHVIIHLHGQSIFEHLTLGAFDFLLLLMGPDLAILPGSHDLLIHVKPLNDSGVGGVLALGQAALHLITVLAILVKHLLLGLPMALMGASCQQTHGSLASPEGLAHGRVLEPGLEKLVFVQLGVLLLDDAAPQGRGLFVLIHCCVTLAPHSFGLIVAELVQPKLAIPVQLHLLLEGHGLLLGQVLFGEAADAGLFLGRLFLLLLLFLLFLLPLRRFILLLRILLRIFILLLICTLLNLFIFHRLWCHSRHQG